jgi:hypothetical protein
MLFRYKSGYKTKNHLSQKAIAPQNHVTVWTSLYQKSDNIVNLSYQRNYQFRIGTPP